MNPKDINWPTDRSGVTSELRRVGVLVSTKLYDDAQLATFQATLDCLNELAKANCESRKASIAKRIEAARLATAEQEAQEATAELEQATARAAALGAVEEAAAIAEAAKTKASAARKAKGK